MSFKSDFIDGLRHGPSDAIRIRDLWLPVAVLAIALHSPGLDGVLAAGGFVFMFILTSVAKIVIQHWCWPVTQALWAVRSKPDAILFGAGIVGCCLGVIAMTGFAILGNALMAFLSLGMAVLAAVIAWASLEAGDRHITWHDSKPREASQSPVDGPGGSAGSNTPENS